MKILIFGSINRDYVYSVDHIVKPGETISSLDNNVFWGGKGFNQAVAVANSGADTSFACMINTSDERPIKEKINSFGIKSNFVKTCDSITGHAIIQIDEAGQNCIIVCPGANKEIDDAFVAETLKSFKKGDVLLLQNEINNLSFIMDKAQEIGMKIVFNPSPFEKKLLDLPLGKVDLFILNEIECQELTSESDFEKMQEKMAVLFPNANLVITLGEKGVIFKNKNESLTHGIYNVQVVDTTAAGDTFTGFFVSNYYNTFDAKESLKIASMASAIAISRKGAIPSIPYKAEVLSSDLKLKTN